MIEIALPLLLIAASAQVESGSSKASPPASAETAKPEPCKDGGPLIAILVSPALGPSPQRMGVLVAIWSDGRIVKARDDVNPENGRVEGRLDAATAEAVYRSLKQRGMWQWKSPPLVFDAQELRTSVCSGRTRLRFSHQPPDAASKPASDLAAYLLSLEVLDAKPTDALGLSSIESWMPWFRSDRRKIRT